MKQRGFRQNEIGVFLALVALIVAVAASNPQAFFQTYTLNLWLFALALIGFVAIGETFVILIGGIDLSPGSVIALTGVIFALTVQALQDSLAPGLAVSIGVLVTLLFGLLIGLVHAFYINRLLVPPFIITLGTLITARGIAELITKGRNIGGMPEAFNWLGANGTQSFPGIPFLPVACAIFIPLAILAAVICNRTTLGRKIYAVGGNVQAARLSGVNVEGVRAFCYGSCAVLSAFAGIVYASSVTFGDPKAGYAYELTAIAAVVIGGTSLAGGIGTITGTLLGVAIMSLLPLGLTYIGVESWWQSITTGIVVVLAVTLEGFRRRRRLVS